MRLLYPQNKTCLAGALAKTHRPTVIRQLQPGTSNSPSHRQRYPLRIVPIAGPSTAGPTYYRQLADKTFLKLTPAGLHTRLDYNQPSLALQPSLKQSSSARGSSKQVLRHPPIFRRRTAEMITENPREMTRVGKATRQRHVRQGPHAGLAHCQSRSAQTS